MPRASKRTATAWTYSASASPAGDRAPTSLADMRPPPAGPLHLLNGAHNAGLLRRASLPQAADLALGLVRRTSSSLAELERYVRVRVERVGQRDPVVAIGDIPLRDEDRGQLLAGQHLLQVFQHSRVRERQRIAPG